MYFISFSLQKVFKILQRGNKCNGMEKCNVNCRIYPAKTACCLQICGPSTGESSYNSIDIKRLQYHFSNSSTQGAHFHMAITMIPRHCSAKYALFLQVNPTAFFPRHNSGHRCYVIRILIYRMRRRLVPRSKSHHITTHQVWQPTISGKFICKNFTFCFQVTAKNTEH